MLQLFMLSNTFRFKILHSAKVDISYPYNLTLRQELHKNEHKNGALILRAMEHLISKDEDSIQKLVHHGLIVKIRIFI